MDPCHCCLSLGDNTSAIGWIYKSNFCNENQIPHEEAARHIASLCIENETCVCAQHFKGKWNVVADSLSRDHHIPAELLTELLRSLCPSQMPKNFHISPLPQEIESWVFRTLQLSNKQPQDPKEPMASMIGVGLVGVDLSKALSSETIPSWIASQKNTHLLSLSASLKQCGPESLAQDVRETWHKARCERPWTKWQRSLQPIAGSIHSKTE